MKYSRLLEKGRGEERGVKFLLCSYIDNSRVTSAHETEWKDSEGQEKNLNLGINIAWLLPT